MDFILASQSESRLNLLKKINCIPKSVIPADIDETPLKKEKPEDYVKRISRNKASKVFRDNPGENILAADSIAVLGRKIMQKPKNIDEMKTFLRSYSNKNVLAITSLCFIKKDGTLIQKIVKTKMKFKSLNQRDIDDCIKFAQAFNCAGGIRTEGFSESLIKSINGSFSNIVGLPLYETRNILISCGVL